MLMPTNDSVKTLAIIVLYNPDFFILNRLLVSVIDQVNHIIVVDNTPNSNLEIINVHLAAFLHKITYKSLTTNQGIAIAQNEGISFAKENSFTHVLLLDQDSELPRGMVSGLLIAEKQLLNKNIKVAAVGPSFIDEKTNEIAPAINVKFMKVDRVEIDSNKSEIQSDYIIASGSLIRIEVLDIVGLMDERLFIDWVDIEWGERCSKFGYGTYIIPSVQMKHSIGDDFVKFLGRNINIHSDFRNYYIVRNATYLMLSNKLKYESRLLFVFKIPCYILFFSILSKRKLYSLKLLLIAVKDGIIGNMGKGHFK